MKKTLVINFGVDKELCIDMEEDDIKSNMDFWEKKGFDDTRTIFSKAIINNNFIHYVLIKDIKKDLQ